MKLSKFREKSNEYTAKASELTRQLCLAGIAIIWLFKKSDTNEPLLEKYLLIPLIFLSIALLVDLSQYIIAGNIWITFFRKKEKEFIDSDIDPDVKAPDNLNKVIYVCYYVKIILMAFSYFFIIGYLIEKI